MRLGLPALVAFFVLPAAAQPDPATAKANALLAQLTLEEKIGQISQFFAFPGMPIDDAVKTGRVGSLLFVTDPKEINRLQDLAAQSRLRIPLIFGFDVIHGFRTIFPVPLGMAASWDPALVEGAQAIAAKEARAVGIHWSFAPMVDIARDPRWGRIVEGAGEDPYLGAAIARAQVKGFQGDHIGADHVLACVKHFAGYGAAEGGRDYDASNIADTQLWNVHLPPFRAAVQAGVGSVMSAYMDLNDVPATGNRWLMHDVLRQSWGFKGFVVSDADAVKSLVPHGFARDGADAALRALHAGINMEMTFGPGDYAKTLASSVEAGRVSVGQIDDAVRPILEAKVRLGLFDTAKVDEARAARVLAAPEHRVAARVAAERSAVLLRNEGSLLPLRPTAHTKLAVIGPLADAPYDQLGSWAFLGDGAETVTVLAGIRAKLGAQGAVEFAQGVQIRRTTPSIFDILKRYKDPEPWSEAQAAEELAKAVAAARRADVAVLVLGELQYMSGEQASRSSLDLPGRQQELLEAVVATGTPVVLVLVNGRPLNIAWASRHVPAILEAWFPGTQGGAAVASLLFGEANPGGKLPITWPKHVGQVPIYYSHNLTQKHEDQAKRYWDDPSEPLYAFGHGLSYAKFAVSALALNRSELAQGAMSRGQQIEISVDVENTGTVAGDEVVQLYVHQRAGSASRPIRELKGFERVSLAPREKKTVRFALGADELRYWSGALRRFVLEPETFDVWVGTDSKASLHGSFKLVPD